jgi:glycosyltransferase involved in cell wall biosynthesis
LEQLDRAGKIEFRTVTGVPSTEMPRLYGSADVVLDQFRIGSYGAAACEAMAAGRVVVSHVTEATRSAVHMLTGRPLPIVEADAATIAEVISDIVANPEPYRATAADGANFVRSIHSGSNSAHILHDRLGMLDS